MSEKVTTYSCSVCTYIQSLDVTKCEMCETPNTLHSKPTKPNDLTYSSGTTLCPACTFNNSGNHVRVCEMCGHEFDADNNPSKKPRVDKSEDEEEEEEDDDDIYGSDNEFYEPSMPQSKDKKRKSIEAVEKPMNDNELKSYYNQYISVLKEQRQQTKKISDKQLHEIILQLFHSLQYKNEQSEGKYLKKKERNVLINNVFL
ncbi:unnamed protein product [Rotaria sp. Silwood2]|nr:unnamed protein product [Rotaria sp. Silwood2]CAF2942940.1 unnamed protein product [Rotaria sp. Silwood2]CAF3967074.1 unnamed protein product [Rotaria sp. Silwood2]